MKRGRISARLAAERLEAVSGTTHYTALAEADLIIEAVFEDLDVKRDVFRRLAAVCRADAILATNTSYLDPERIAADIGSPERFLGLHFFSPAQVMKLLEIVPTQATAPEVLATGFALARMLNKIPVRAGISDGFIGNRILKVMRAQAERLLLGGATPAAVDAAMRAFGLPMGPFEAQDLGGLYSPPSSAVPPAPRRDGFCAGRRPSFGDRALRPEERRRLVRLAPRRPNATASATVARIIGDEAWAAPKRLGRGRHRRLHLLADGQRLRDSRRRNGSEGLRYRSRGDPWLLLSALGGAG